MIKYIFIFLFTATSLSLSAQKNQEQSEDIDQSMDDALEQVKEMLDTLDTNKIFSEALIQMKEAQLKAGEELDNFKLNLDGINLDSIFQEGFKIQGDGEMHDLGLDEIEDMMRKSIDMLQDIDLNELNKVFEGIDFKAFEDLFDGIDINLEEDQDTGSDGKESKTKKKRI